MRATSETVGFVLVFSVVTMTIGVTYAAGVSGITEARDAEQLRNVERAFDVLADNLEDLHRRGAPSRATEIKLAGGEIRIGDEVELRIEATNTSDPSRNATFATHTRPIVYESDAGTKIVYTAGAILRSDGRNSVMLERPAWLVDPARTVVPLIDVDGAGSIAGTGTVLVVADRAFTKLEGSFNASGPGEVRVNVTVRTPRSDAWGRLLRDRGFDVTTSPGVVNATVRTERLYVAKTKIEASLTG